MKKFSISVLSNYYIWQFFVRLFFFNPLNNNYIMAKKRHIAFAKSITPAHCTVCFFSTNRLPLWPLPIHLSRLLALHHIATVQTPGRLFWAIPPDTTFSHCARIKEFVPPLLYILPTCWGCPSPWCLA